MTAIGWAVGVRRAQCKADAERADNYGLTPVYAAALNGHEAALRFLVTEVASLWCAWREWSRGTVAAVSVRLLNGRAAGAVQGGRRARGRRP